MRHMQLLLLTIFVSLYVSLTVCEEHVNHLNQQGYAEINGSYRGFITLNNTTYYFDTTNKATWSEAKNFCRSMGMFLLSIETAGENELIVDYILTVTGAGNYWMSGNDVDRTVGDFVWDSTGQRVIYKDFHYGQPVYAANTYLAYYWGQNILKWANFYSNPYPYNIYTICEKPK